LPPQDQRTSAEVLAPWRELALTSFQHVVDLANAHSELAGSPGGVLAVTVREGSISSA
jgi:hypothetical protein